MNVSRLALAISLPLAVAAQLAFAPSVEAQKAQERQRNQQRQQAQQPAQQQAQQQGPRVSPAELAAIRPLSEAVRAQNWPGAAAALPAAQAGAQSPAARFEVGRLHFQMANATNDRAGQIAAVDAMLNSGAAPETAMPSLLGARATYAIQASDWATSDQILTRLTQLQPNDLERIRQHAEVKIRLNRNNEALALYQRLLQVAEASGQQPTEEQLRRARDLAIDQQQTQLAAQLSERLLRAFPNQNTLRDALVNYRRAVGEDTELAIDVRRLMRVAGSFARAADYAEFANRLSRLGYIGEAKAVLDEGVSRGTVNASDPDVRQMLTAANARIDADRAGLPAMRTRALAAATGREARIAGDTFYGYGQYAQAAELYRAALQKGGQDANLVNSRLGAALAGAGQTAEAQAAFRAVTGPRQQLAQFWLLWLERRPAS